MQKVKYSKKKGIFKKNKAKKPKSKFLDFKNLFGGWGLSKQKGGGWGSSNNLFDEKYNQYGGGWGSTSFFDFF